MSIYFGAGPTVPVVEVADVAQYLTQNHGVLLDLLPRAGLTAAEVLQMTTIVAPTNEAFADLMKELNNVPPKPEDLKELLLYHCSSSAVKNVGGVLSPQGVFETGAKGKTWEIRGHCVWGADMKQSCVEKFVQPKNKATGVRAVLVADRVLRLESAAKYGRGGGHMVHFMAH